MSRSGKAAAVIGALGEGSGPFFEHLLFQRYMIVSCGLLTVRASAADATMLSGLGIALPFGDLLSHFATAAEQLLHGRRLPGVIVVAFSIFAPAASTRIIPNVVVISEIIPAASATTVPTTLLLPIPIPNLVVVPLATLTPPLYGDGLGLLLQPVRIQDAPPPLFGCQRYVTVISVGDIAVVGSFPAEHLRLLHAFSGSTGGAAGTGPYLGGGLEDVARGGRRG